jgi:uncharacterized membrane protein YfhO
VDAPAATTLLLADPMFPGWRARIDGTRVTIASRTGSPVEIGVPAGRHAVEISYEPLSFRLGVVLGGAAFLALGAAAWRLDSSERRAARQPGRDRPSG